MLPLNLVTLVPPPVPWITAGPGTKVSLNHCVLILVTKPYVRRFASLKHLFIVASSFILYMQHQAKLKSSLPKLKWYLLPSKYLQYIVWLALHDEPYTRTKLHKWGITVVLLRVICLGWTLDSAMMSLAVPLPLYPRVCCGSIQTGACFALCANHGDR